MVSTTYLEPVAKRFLLVTNILSSVKIDNLVVPEVVANDCAGAVLDCAYSGAGDDVTVLWLHDGSQVYEWRRGYEPEVRGVLQGRLDLTYRLTSGDGVVVQRALHIVELTLELSGEYTCVVRSHGHEARATNTMTVFSPERDFELTLNSTVGSDVVDIKCVAKHLHPQPDLVIEYNKIPIGQQQQRTWREGEYFDAECSATLGRGALRSPAPAELACRLQLPQVDYTAITKKYLHYGNRDSMADVTKATAYVFFLTIIFQYINSINQI